MEECVEEVVCNLCASDRWQVLQVVPVQRFGPPGEFNLVQCQDCGMRYLNPRPSPAEMKGYYPAAYREYRTSIDESLRRSYQEGPIVKEADYWMLVVPMGFSYTWRGWQATKSRG
jgi:hypothetical protein